MKNKILATAMLLVLLVSITPIMPTLASGSALGGTWFLDEGRGNVAYDSSGNGNHGTIYSAVWVSGKVGKALEFDGVNDYVEVPDSNSLDITGKITVEAWIYPHTMTQQVIVAKYNHSAPYNGAYYLGLGGYGYMNKILFALSPNGYNFYYMLSNTNITANMWTHVAGTSNGTHMIIYINGVKDKVVKYTPGVIFASNAPLRIGAYLPELGYPRFFDGIIDEVRVAAGTIWTVDDDRVQCPTADFTSIQAAINAASSGDTIIVHDGTYVENVNVNKPVTLESASHPTIDGNQAGPCVTIAANGVLVDGFELINGTYGVASWGTDNSVVSNNIIHDILNVPGYAGCGIMFWSDSDDFDNNTIRFNEIYDNDRQGIYIGGETSSYISERNVIRGNVIYNNGLNRTGQGPDASAYGIQLSFADDNVIEGNEIYWHDDWFPYPGFDFAQGIYLFDSNNNQITNNNLHDNNYGVGIWRPSRAAGTNYINYNNIAGNTGYGVRTFDGLPAVDARFNWWGHSSGPTHSSNLGGSGDRISNNVDYSPWLGFLVGTSPMNWHVNPTGAPSAIQEAIDEASAGDTILVHNGTYNEALYINKNLAIKAASAPVVKGGQLRATNYGNRAATIFVEDASNVILQNLDVEGQGLSGKSYAILYENSGGTVQGCIASPNTVGDMGSVAIAAWDNSNLTIKECVIQNFGRIGVYSNNATISIENNTIIGQVYNQDNLVNYGIEIEDYSGPSIANITQNVIYNCNNTHPAPLWSSGAIIVDTWREWADVYGLTLLPSKVAITYNEIYDNYESIEIVANEFSHAHYNNFYNNTWGVWSAPENWTTNPTYYVFNATCNWWGDDSGPYHATSWMYMGSPYGPHYGLGDNVSDYVLYDPWLPLEQHDISIINVTTSTPKARPGRIVNITVVVKNNGDVSETFNVTAYRDNIPIGTILVTDLGVGENTTVIFQWNTVGLTPCHTWTIKADAPLAGDANPGDNTLTDGTVKIMMLGDLDEDGDVDIFDIRIAARAFGSRPGDPKWNPDADLMPNGIIDIFDLRRIAKEYGKTCP